MSGDNWAVFKNLYLYEEPLFAAVLVKRTEKTVSFARSAGSRTSVRSSDWLVMDGVSEAEARAIQAKDAASLAIMRAEVEAARSAQFERRSELLKAESKRREGR